MSDNPLIAKLRAKRASTVEIDGRTFTVRRPTLHEYLQYRSPDNKIHIPVEDLRKFVTDWSGFTEHDFWGGGSGDAVPFDHDLFMEWVVDYPKVWSRLLNEVLEAFNRYIQSRDDIAKN
jgi:hypothetical protein